MKKKINKILKVTGIVFGSIVLFFAIIALIISIILTPKRLTPLVNKYSTQYLDADVNFSSVNLSLFEELPFISLKLIDGNVISHAFQNEPDSLKAMMPIQADSLLQFKELLVSLNLPSLAVGKVDIRRIRVVEPKAYAYVSPSGKASWEIYTSTDTTESAPLDLNIERIAVVNSGDIVYHSVPDSMKLKVDIGRLFLRGKLTADVNKLDIEMVRISELALIAEIEGDKMKAKFIIDTMRVGKNSSKGYSVGMLSHTSLKIDTVSYCNNLPISLKGDVAVKDKAVVFNDLNLSVSDIKALFNGGVTVGENLDFSDFSVVVDSVSMASLISIIPKELSPALKGIRTDVIVNLLAKVNGAYNATTGALPLIDVDMKIPGGGIYNDATNLKFKNVALDVAFHHNPKKASETGVVIRKLKIDGAVLSLDAKGEVLDVMKDPNINMEVKGNISLTKMAGIFKLLWGMDVEGDLGMDLNVKSKLSYFNMAKIGNAQIKGRMTVDDFKLNIPKDTIDVAITGGIIRFGAYENKRDTQIAKGEHMLRVGMRIDKVNVKYKNGILLNASDAKLSVGSAASSLSGDKSEVHPLKGSVEAERLYVVLEDSSSYRIRSTKIGVNVLPLPENKKIPVISLDLNSKSLVFRQSDMRGTLANSNIVLNATINKRMIGAKERNKRRLDSLQLVYPKVKRDSLFAHSQKIRIQRRGVVGKQDDLKSGDIDFSVDKSVNTLLQRWNITGKIKADAGRVITPYFPLGGRFRNFDLDFTTNEVNLYSMKLISGKSQLDMHGKISGIRRVLMGRGKLKIDFDVDADMLNVNELMQSANAGMAYVESSDEYKQSLAEARSDEEMQKLIDKNNEESGVSDLIIVPANIDMDIKMRVREGLYSKLTLDTVSVEIIARDRNLQIKELKAETNAGAISLTALYSTKSKHDISTGFDLELKDIEVKKFIDLMPAVDTLLPMLRSFDGVITCQIAATAAMDSTMNIILPTLQAACRINGNNMVLLDGETFSDISKMMKFKNRDKNIIDKISVELLIHDNQIEVFPFVMEMDRYKTAISGVHKLNMDFSYHISVLHSPLPFRVGVTISGNTDDMDNMKFKIGRAKYKNAEIPTYTTVVDTTRVNLRNYITDIFRQGIEAADIKSADIVHKVKLPIEEHGIEELSHQDSLRLQQEGIIEATPKVEQESVDVVEDTKGMSQTKKVAVPEDKRKNRRKR